MFYGINIDERRKGSQNTNSLNGGSIMANLQRYRTADLPDLLDRITRNSIGMNDDYFDRFLNLQQTTNYPPYNLVNVSNHESRLEIALAGFKKG